MFSEADEDGDGLLFKEEYERYADLKYQKHVQKYGGAVKPTQEIKD